MLVRSSSGLNILFVASPPYNGLFLLAAALFTCSLPGSSTGFAAAKRHKLLVKILRFLPPSD